MTTVPGTYLQYLPAIYAERADDFLAGFLDIFRKLLTGLDDDQLAGRKGIQQLLAADVIGELFYPRFGFLFPDDPRPLPPISGQKPEQEALLLAALDTFVGAANPLGAPRSSLAAATPGANAAITAWLHGLLDWLAGWVGVSLESDWSLDKKRLVVAQILALQRCRGTAQGLQWLIDLWFDLPVTLTGTSLSDPTTSVTGPLSVSVANPQPRGIVLADTPTSPTVFRLADRADAAGPLVSGSTRWTFDVVVTLPTQDHPNFVPTGATTAIVRTLVAQLRALVERSQPAGTTARLAVRPGLRLGAPFARLGVTTLL